MEEQHEIAWEYRVPGSEMILGGGKVLLIGFSITYLLGEIVSWFFRTSFTLYLISAAKRGEIGVWMSASFFILIAVFSLLVTALLYRNGYPMRFTITDKGVFAETMQEQRKANRTVQRLAVLSSMASGRPGGVAAAAASRACEKAWISWSDLKKILPDPDSGKIRLKNSWRTVVVLYCPPDLYAQVLQTLYQHKGQVWQ